MKIIHGLGKREYESVEATGRRGHPAPLCGRRGRAGFLWFSGQARPPLVSDGTRSSRGCRRRQRAVCDGNYKEAKVSVQRAECSSPEVRSLGREARAVVDFGVPSA